jgi:hypothetical protein
MSPSTKLKEPSILLASSNCQKLLRNVAHILDAPAIDRLSREIEKNVVALFDLGEDHLAFARGIPAKHWRQRVSRLYYAALNIKRGVTLHYSGDFSTDVSDHKNIGDLPKGFPNANMYATRLENLRDDRNIADYSHLSSEADLVLPASEAEKMVADFQKEARAYLAARGVSQ